MADTETKSIFDIEPMRRRRPRSTLAGLCLMLRSRSGSARGELRTSCHVHYPKRSARSYLVEHGGCNWLSLASIRRAGPLRSMTNGSATCWLLVLNSLSGLIEPMPSCIAPSPGKVLHQAGKVAIIEIIVS